VPDFVEASLKQTTQLYMYVADKLNAPLSCESVCTVQVTAYFYFV